MKKLFFLLLLPSLLIFACSRQDITLDDYPNSGLLVSAAQLSEALESSNIFLIDARAETGDTLIPGAIHFAAISELTDPDHPVASFLIPAETFQEKMRAIGLNNNDRVVIYDEGNALASARLFYAMEYYGFSNASILNGGIQAWLDQDLPITDTPSARETGNFSGRIDESRSCDITYVMEAAGNPNTIIFDARSEDEYTGTDVRSERGGHIPNAVNLEWSRVLEPEGIPFFLPAQQIQDKYTSLGITPDKEVIPHCHTNVRGSHAYFTLRLMGYDSVRPYEGSWAEYGNNPDAIIQ
jgi:thiosulfate/3-mercaptopyruvate sulfurtransferase